ncbi:mismatch repair endonuclease PMS2 [Aphelenchoides avenae]|nr:mismatch repair endonuclease PMS2 [Aphelenchus avenae]
MTEPPHRTNLVKPLNEEVSRRICTGQVIISLPGACRELLDNALDAGATTIEVRVKENGTELLEVIDNGSGIEAVNFDALCKPHSTSKLSSITDFNSLTTFGFRGEALNALAELGNVTITTRHQDAPVATKITFDNRGEVTRKDPCPRQMGTTVSVAELFAPLPVRRQEFVRTSKKELIKMLSTVQSFALSRTDVRFICVNFVGGKRIEMLSTPGGSASVKETISSLFGARSEKGNFLDIHEAVPDEETKAHYGVKVENDAIFDKIHSCEYGQGRHSADRQFVYVNKRPVDFAKVCRIANEVYGSYNRGQYCMLVLFVEVDPASLDVNVSPDKRTVFLHAEKELFAKLRASLGATFEKVHGKCPKAGASEDWSTLATQSQISSILHAEMNSTDGGSDNSFIIVNDGDLDTSRSQLSDCALETPQAEVAASFSHIDNDVLGERVYDRYADSSDGERCSSRASDLFQETSGAHKRARLDPSSNGTDAFKRPSLAHKNGGSLAAKSSTTRTLEAFAFKTARELAAERAAQGNGHESTAADELHAVSRGSTLVITLHQPSSNAVDPSTPPTTTGTLLHAPSSSVQRRISPIRHERTSTELIVNAFHDASMFDEDERGDLSIDAVANDSTTDPMENAEELEAPSGSNDVVFVGTQGATTFMTTQSQKLVRPQQSVQIDLNILRERMNEIRQRLHQQRDSSTELVGEQYQLEVEKSKDIEADQPAEIAEQNLSLLLKKEDFARMRIIGQFNSAFIIARLDNQLFVVDQHASDEKYNFERLQRKALVQSQKLITPQLLQVGAVHEAVLRDNVDVFRANGFDFDFDEDDIDEILGVVSEFPGTMYRPAKLRKIFASRACRKSVMFGDPLSRQQMHEIVRHMGKMDQPWNCPHGRPTIRHLCTMRKVPAVCGASENEEEGTQVYGDTVEELNDAEMT